MTNILADNRHDTGWTHAAEMEQVASDAASAEVPYREADASDALRVSLERQMDEAAYVPGYRANLVQMRADGIAATAEERDPVEVGNAIHQRIEQRLKAERVAEAKRPDDTFKSLLSLLAKMMGDEAKIGAGQTPTERKNDPEYRAARKEEVTLRQAATGLIYRFILDGRDKGRTLDEVLKLSVQTVGPMLAAEIIRTLENVYYAELTDDNRIVAIEYLVPAGEERDIREEVQLARAAERATDEKLN